LPKYFIIAGEASADKHGAFLMKAMLNRNPNLQFDGIGGYDMKSIGQNQLFTAEQMSIMGFTEVFRHLKFLKNVKSVVIQHIRKSKPDKIVLIDYPGFNLRLAKEIKKIEDIPIIYYISPQLWAWKESRIKVIKQYIDKMLVILPFEKDWYNERGLEVEFVGHPILDQLVPRSRKVVAKELSLVPDKPILTLFPGSRTQELNRHLKLFCETAMQVKEQMKDVQIVLGLAKGFEIKDFSSNIDINDIKVETENPSSALEIADVAIVASGTSTLEAAVYETPSVIVYKLSYITWLISKLLVKVPFVGLVNIISGKEVFPELLQNKATVKNISQYVMKILSDNNYHKNMINEIKTVKNSLGGQGASERSAKLIMSDEY